MALDQDTQGISPAPACGPQGIAARLERHRGVSQVGRTEIGDKVINEKKTTPSDKKAALEAIRAEFKGIDSATQRSRLLEALRRLGAVSTYEARRYLDIYYPPSRISELREEGHEIQTVRTTITTEAGEDHRVGLYLFASEVAHDPA